MGADFVYIKHRATWPRRDKLAMTGKASWLQVYLFVKAETVLTLTLSSQHHHPLLLHMGKHLSVKYRVSLSKSEPLYTNHSKIQKQTTDKTEIMHKMTVQMVGQRISKLWFPLCGQILDLCKMWSLQKTNSFKCCTPAITYELFEASCFQKKETCRASGFNYGSRCALSAMTVRWVTQWQYWSPPTHC